MGNRQHLYKVTVRKKGGHAKQFDVKSRYTHGWFIKAVKELIEKMELGEIHR